ncbi:MAG: WYL domain-containing protein [Clostridium sp.]|nr:WYL domain-containing protein [Clostridium sp.]
MAKNLLNRYVWIIDTIRRHSTISRRELNEYWMRSPYSNGEPLARRTFYNYRQAIEDLFGIRIVVSPSTYEYSIANDETAESATLTDWVLNSASMSDTMVEMQHIADRIFLEEVPSARLFLSPITKAMRDYHPVRFSYHPYNRSLPTPGVAIEPYFLKIFRQRWYLTGRNQTDGKIKTYALDRMSELTVSTSTFAPPPDFDPREFVRDAFGIIFTQGPVHQVSLRVDSRRAKYFRALPLHCTQDEAIHDSFSIFTYRLRLTPDFVQEILSYGPDITVLGPPELKAMVVKSLKESLANYSPKNTSEKK